VKLKFVKTASLLCSANLFDPPAHFGGKMCESAGTLVPSCILAAIGA
jgi:hypothetical protein